MENVKLILLIAEKIVKILESGKNLFSLEKTIFKF